MTFNFLASSAYRSLLSPAPSSSTSKRRFSTQQTISKGRLSSLNKRQSDASGMQGGSEGFLRSWAQRGFLGTVLIEFMIVITIISILVRDEFWNKHLDNFTRVQYAVLSSMVLLSLDALRAGNIVQVVSVSAFNIPILFYSIIQRVNGFDAFFNQKDSNGSLSSCGGAAGFEAVEESPCFPARQAYDKHVHLLTAAPVVIGLAQISYVWLTYALAKEFGWNAFRKLGGDLGLKRMNDWDLRLSTLLKIFFSAIYAIYSTIFAVQTLHDSKRALPPHTRGLIIFVMVLQYLLLVTPLLAIWALQKEHRWLMYITLGWILIGTGLLIPLTFTQVYAPRDKWDWYTQTTKIIRVVLAVISIILTLTTIGLGVFVARAQFGEGLKESREAAQVAASTPRGQYFDEEAGDEMSGLASAGRRVTIE